MSSKSEINSTASTKQMKYLAKIAVKVVVLAILVGLALATQDMGKIAGMIAKANYYYFMPYLLLGTAMVALASTNLFLLLRPLDIDLRWRRLFYFDALSLAGSYYTPGGMGGIGIVVYMMKREGVKLSDSAVVVLMDKVITLAVAVLFSVIYLLAYSRGWPVMRWNWLTILALLSVLGIAVMLSRRKFSPLAQKIKESIRCYARQYSPLLANSVITMGNYCLTTLAIALAFSAAGVTVSMTNLEVILVSCGILGLINMLPISFNGIGVGEMAAVYLWAESGLSSEEILAAFIVWRIFALVTTLLLSGAAIAIWLFERRGEGDVHGTT